MPPWPGLAPCDSLISIAFTDGCRGFVRERRRVEGAGDRATAEVAGADLPDQVGTALEVIGAEATLAGVDGEAGLGGSQAERLHCRGAERPEAHTGAVEQRGRVRLGAVGTTDHDPAVRGCRQRLHRVGEELVSRLVDVLLGAERQFVSVTLRPLVHDGADLSTERRAVGLRLHEVLLDLRADPLGQVAAVSEDGVEPEDRVGALDTVVQPDGHDQAHGNQRPQRGRPPQQADSADGRRDDRGEDQERATRGHEPPAPPGVGRMRATGTMVVIGLPGSSDRRRAPLSRRGTSSCSSSDERLRC